jgi:hypothetical protein
LLFFVVAAGDAVPFCGGGVWGWRSRGKLWLWRPSKQTKNGRREDLSYEKVRWKIRTSRRRFSNRDTAKSNRCQAKNGVMKVCKGRRRSTLFGRLLYRKSGNQAGSRIEVANEAGCDVWFWHVVRFSFFYLPVSNDHTQQRTGPPRFDDFVVFSSLLHFI